MGGWFDRKIEEEEAVRMRYCTYGVGWVGGEIEEVGGRALINLPLAV